MNSRENKVPFGNMFSFSFSRDAMYGRMEAVCPFFVFYSITDIVESFLPNALLDLKIDKETLNMFRASSGPQNEQYYWPSASTFTVTCLFESASIRCEMLGIQRQVRMFHIFYFS